MDFDKYYLPEDLLPSAWLIGGCAASIIIFLCVGVVVNEEKISHSASYEIDVSAIKECRYLASYPGKYRLIARREIVISARKKIDYPVANGSSGCGRD